MSCEGCKKEIENSWVYKSSDGKIWHMLCWEKECNDYYYEQTLKGDEE